MTQPLQGWGLGVGDIPPRVTALPQPWAVRQNPVGIPDRARQLADTVRTALPGNKRGTVMNTHMKWLTEFWKLEKEAEKMLEGLAR
jgi:hypothetical protein